MNKYIYLNSTGARVQEWVAEAAFFELFLGIASFICGLLGLIKKESIGLSIIVMIFGLLICVFFVFIYLLGEAGIAPPITWFYKE